MTHNQPTRIFTVSVRRDGTVRVWRTGFGCIDETNQVFVPTQAECGCDCETPRLDQLGMSTTLGAVEETINLLFADLQVTHDDS